jgi:ABC-type lipoprotein export system ATPase subunit
MTEMIKSEPLKRLFDRYPFARDWLDEYMFLYDENKSMEENLKMQHDLYYGNLGRTRGQFLADFRSYIEDMERFLGGKEPETKCLTVYPGRDKSGNGEDFARIDIRKGSVITVVGPTGSGKSRLLADIEWGADGDTPTGRRVHIDGRPVQRGAHGNAQNKMVAQLSQNMNFVIDLDVGQFLKMHAQCRFTENADEKVKNTFEKANQLAGEAFDISTHVTHLSGGQSRALMIADCALLSAAPIVLIDELENAGIQRKEALDLLSGEDKIVLMATHDPVLALLADFRIIVKNGGIRDVIQKDESEERILKEAWEMDARMQGWRDTLREGKRLKRQS